MKALKIAGIISLCSIVNDTRHIRGALLGGDISTIGLRDGMGRYADGYSGDGYSGEGASGRRGYSRAEAKDKLISQMESMMGTVSPQAQKAIERAISKLEEE